VGYDGETADTIELHGEARESEGQVELS